MALPQISHRTNPQSAFTLIEMMMVIALIAALGGVGLFLGIDSYRSYSFHSERDLVVSMLQHARAQAMGNACISGPGVDCSDGRPHGVAISPPDHPKSYVLYQASTTAPGYAHRDTSVDVYFDRGPLMSATSTGAYYYEFQVLSGNVSLSGTTTLSDVVQHVSDIHVDTDGQIEWTH